MTSARQAISTGLMVQQGRDHLALAQLRGGQAPGHRQPIPSGQDIQAEPPEEAVVALAVAVAGDPGQRRAADRLAGGRTWQRGGVDQPQLVAEAWGVGGDVLDGEGDQSGGVAQPAVVGRGGRQVREQVAKASAGEPQPAPLGVAAEQDLGDGQTDQLGIAELGLAAWATTGTEQVIDHDVECDDEGVEIGAHEASQEVDVASATPILGALV